MKYLLKNSYLFLIIFILLICKDNIKNIISYDNITINKIIYINEENTTFNKAKLLYQNPYNFQKEIFITTQSDVYSGDFVINDLGLVGIIKNVYKDKSRVMLLTNENIILQVKVNNCYGLLKYDEYLYIDNIDNTCNINIGDMVNTSNLNKIKSIQKIGIVDKKIISSDKASYIYKISPYVNFNNLNNLIVVS